MKKVLKSIDIFPLNFQFYIKDRQLKKTTTGGVSSLMLIITTLALVTYNIYNYINNRVPLVISTQEFYGYTPAEPFNLSNINIISMFYTSNLSLIEIQLVNSLAFLQKFDLYGNPILQYIPIGSLVRCNQASSDYSKNLSNLLKTRIGINPNYTTCFNKNDSSTHIELGGNLALTNQSRSIILQASYNICSNNLIKDYCNNLIIFDNIPTIFTLYYSNYYSNMEKEEGYLEFQDYDSYEIQVSQDILIIINIKKNVVYSDDNYIFNFRPAKKYVFYTISNINFIPKKRLDDVNIIKSTFMIQLDKYQQMYRRSYIKIDQLLSNTMSIFSVLFLIFENITKTLEIGSINHYFMKKLYFFEREDSNDKLFKTNNEIIVRKIKKANYVHSKIYI